MFPLLLHDILGVLKHLLLPKVEEIGRIRVEFKRLFAIIPGTGRGKKHTVLKETRGTISDNSLEVQ